MARLINGNSVQGITAQTDADFYGGIAGDVTGILAIGRRMEAEVVNNTPRIYDGTLLTKEGRRVQIDYGSYDDFSIPAGTEGVTRYFLIGYKLTTESNGAQTCSTFVETSTASGTIEEHMLKDGYTDVYISLYRVTQTGTVNTISDCLRPQFASLALADEAEETTERNISWRGLNVKVSVYRGKLVLVSVVGTLTQAINIRSSAVTIATLSDIRPDREVSGWVILSSTYSARYRWLTNGTFQLSNGRNLTDGSMANIPTSLMVGFNFAFSL